MKYFLMELILNLYNEILTHIHFLNDISNKKFNEITKEKNFNKILLEF